MPEQYTYQVGKINFIVTPVYKDKRSGETMKDILLKLMLADLESGDILNIGGTLLPQTGSKGIQTLDHP